MFLRTDTNQTDPKQKKKKEDKKLVFYFETDQAVY